MRAEQFVVLDIQENKNTDLSNEIGSSSRVAEFHAFVAENAEAMVESERAPGHKAPFGVLMGMCAAEISEENVEMFFAEAHAMLARATEKTEEEADDTDDEEKTETEEKLHDKQSETTEIKKPASPAKLEQPTRPEQSKQVIDIAEAKPQASENPTGIAASNSVEPVIDQPLVEIADKEPDKSEQPKMVESSQSSQVINKSEKVEQATQSQIVPQVQNKVEVRDINETIKTNRQAELRNAIPQPHEADTTKKIEVKSPAQSDVVDPNKNPVDSYFELPTRGAEALSVIEDTEKDVVLSAKENFSEDYEIAWLEATYQIPDIENEEAAPFDAETYTDEQLEELFEPETIETYNELLDLIESGEIGLLAVEKPLEDLTEVSLDLIESDAEEHSFNKFEAFIADQPTIEEPVTLEAIQEQANEQPLQQTLLQLTELLASDAEGASEPEQVELYQILREIVAELPACYYISQEAEEPKLKITSELTEKLLALLRHLGYEHPKEALVDLVKQYGLAFLLQALQYICQLNSEYEKREFTIASVSIAKGDDEDTRLRIGKALFGLISELNFEPAQTSSV